MSGILANAARPRWSALADLSPSEGAFCLTTAVVCCLATAVVWSWAKCACAPVGAKSVPISRAAKAVMRRARQIMANF